MKTKELGSWKVKHQKRKVFLMKMIILLTLKLMYLIHSLLSQICFHT